jgi:hypothetical protein
MYLKILDNLLIKNYFPCLNLRFSPQRSFKELTQYQIFKSKKILSEFQTFILDHFLF